METIEIHREYDCFYDFYRDSNNQYFIYPKKICMPAAYKWTFESDFESRWIAIFKGLCCSQLNYNQKTVRPSGSEKLDR